jgi:hypothetical protein
MNVIKGPRAAELLRLQRPHHASCSGSTAGVAANDPDWFNRERFRLHRVAAERDAATRQNGQAFR